MEILDNVSLKDFNTFGIDVIAQKFCSIKTKENILELIQNKKLSI